MTISNILCNPTAIHAVAKANRPGIILDFDGTISEIAPTPASAVIHPRIAEALDVAVSKFSLVAVLSGRAVRDVAARVAIPSVTYVGNHGAESIVNGQLRVLSASAPAGIVQALEYIRRTVDVPGIVYEDKRFSASIHYRQVEDVKAVERQLRRAINRAPGSDMLDSFWGRMVLEIRPATAITKGDAIAYLSSQHSLDALLFVGDDTTDIDGMRRLPALEGVRTVGVAVVSNETPELLIEAADYQVSDVDQVADLLDLIVASRPESLRSTDPTGKS